MLRRLSSKARKLPVRAFSSGNNGGGYDISGFNFEPVLQTPLRGAQIVQDPLTNKGTGFSALERERLRIRGLVPPRTLSLKTQAEKIMHAVRALPNDLEKNKYLSELQDRNETLYFKVLIDNIEELAPIVYTPTVGNVCLRFGSYFKRPRGMYFSSYDRGLMSSMTYNWPHEDVEVVVVTDGSRILGLGDLGANGMGIPIGKLALYVSAGGIDPRRVLPVMLDLGTDNKSLLNDPWYLGVQHPRLRGDEYYALVHEFVNAIHYRWPNALIQFEDFSSDKAAVILDTYRRDHLCFNDDIQGTGAVTLGALLAAIRTQGESARLSDQRIVVVGAGSAGMGVCHSVHSAMLLEGLTPAEARDRFWVIDKDGLIGAERSASVLNREQRAFQRASPSEELQDRASIHEVIKAVKPTVLLGFTGQGGAFTEEVVRELAAGIPGQRPILFPLSNPTSNAECTAEQAYRWTNGRVVFGSGSPFAPFESAAENDNGRIITPSQINNMFIFPGVGLACNFVRPRIVTDGMMLVAARAVAQTVSHADLAIGRVVPRVKDIRMVSARVAAATAQAAIQEGVAQPINGVNCDDLDQLANYFKSKMYTPKYQQIINRPLQ